MLRYYGGGGEHINRFGSALTRNDFQTAKLNADSTEYEIVIKKIYIQ